MRLQNYWALAVVTGLALSAGQVRANHIPGHSNDDPIFPCPFPTQEFWNGDCVIAFITLIGPDGGETIYTTNLDITYVSDGVTPPSDLIIVISTFVDGEFRELDISGADLGFGSGPGTYQGTWETDIFNGVIDGGFPGPFSTINLDLGSTSGPVCGNAYFVDSFINFTIQEPAPIPSVSQWGFAVLTLLLLGVAAIVFRRRIADGGGASAS